jgi:hypothetical protein
MSIKADELERRLEQLKKLENLLQKEIQQGYICGLINGIRISRSVIAGEDYILEREEVQRPGDNGSTMIMPKYDVTTGNKLGFVLMTFDEHGGLLKLEHT